MTASDLQLDCSIQPSSTPKSTGGNDRQCVISHRRTSAENDHSEPVPAKSTETPESEQTCGEINLAFSEPTPSLHPSYGEWFQEHATKSRFMTYFVAFWAHWMAVLCMAALFSSDSEEFPPITLDAVFSEVEPDSDVLLEYADVAFEIPSTKAPSTPSEVLNTETVHISVPSPALDEVPLEKIPDALLALAIDSQAPIVPARPMEKEKLKAQQPPMIVPRHAVAAGSFAVWTEPENPDPGQPYRIIIQIRLPDGTEKYSVADLEGVVVGSDGYQKLIPGPLRGFLPVQDGIVKLEVHIVSADQNVQDTVFIRSKLLREAQRLRIQF